MRSKIEGGLSFTFFMVSLNYDARNLLKTTIFKQTSPHENHLDNCGWVLTKVHTEN